MKRVLVGVVLLAGCLFWVGDVGATSQFSRKEGISCSACHLGFPRLNEFGEKYMRAGYRVPDSKSVHAGEKLSLESVSHYLGVRLNVDAVSWEDGNPDSTVAFGNDKWAQFFVAGNVADKVSFFTEIELTSSNTHYSWWKLGYHGESQKFNVTVGNQSPVDHSAFSNRLRILPAVKSELYGLKTSTDGADPDGMGGFDSVSSVNASSARRGIQGFGDLGHFVYYAGISNGTGDVSDAINWWGGLRWYFPTEGKLAGSSISATYYLGSDVYGSGPAQVENEFSWWMPALNIRAGGLDIQAYGRFVTEDNIGLVLPPTPEVEEDWDGWGLTAGWMINERWQPAIQYDKIDPNTIIPVTESEWVTVALSYFPLENLRIAAHYRSDEFVKDNDQFFVNIRMMF